MIHKLKVRFIGLCMISLTILLAVLIGTINLINYRSVLTQADSILEVLSSNRGSFPEYLFGQDTRPAPPWSPETPYESRYFSVFFNTASDIDRIDLTRVAAVTETQAAAMADLALTRRDVHGFVGDYRYWKSADPMGTKVFFLDCHRELEACSRFLWTSIGISLGGWFVMFALISLCAGRIIRPVAETYQKQKQFITDASHEIRTPLTIISANVDLLEMDLEDENESLEEIRSQVKRLKTLTENLTALTRMEESSQKVRIDFPISDVVEESARPFYSLAKNEDKILDLHIEPHLFWKGNDQSIRQLISLLLDNAIKYSSPKGIISLSLHQKGNAIHLMVENPIETPIEEKDLNQIFERFYRTDPSRSSKKKGYGIGLSMAKALVENENGRIEATCPNPHLFSILVTLPCRKR